MRIAKDAMGVARLSGMSGRGCEGMRNLVGVQTAST
jgi:hypothetical protein